MSRRRSSMLLSNKRLVCATTTTTPAPFRLFLEVFVGLILNRGKTLCNAFVCIELDQAIQKSEAKEKTKKVTLSEIAIIQIHKGNKATAK